MYVQIFHVEGEITTTTTPTTTTTNQVVDCGAGWTSYKEKCYRLFPAPLSWTSASAQCEANSGHLASAPNRETEDFLVGLAKNFSSGFYRISFWIGGYRREDDCQWNGEKWEWQCNEEWQWKDGSPWNYTNWAIAEPNNLGGKEHHLELRMISVWTEYDRRNWNDEHHKKQNGYICQNGGECKKISIIIHTSMFHYQAIFTFSLLDNFPF